MTIAVIQCRLISSLAGFGPSRFATLGGVRRREPQPERDWPGQANRLSSFNEFYRFTVTCLHSGCGHSRSVPVSFLKAHFKGGSTLGEIGQRFRCSACGKRGAKLMPYSA